MAIIASLEHIVEPLENGNGDLVDFRALSTPATFWMQSFDTVRQATTALAEYGDISDGEHFATCEQVTMDMAGEYRATTYRVFRDLAHAQAYCDRVAEIWESLGIVS